MKKVMFLSLILVGFSFFTIACSDTTPENIYMNEEEQIKITEYQEVDSDAGEEVKTVFEIDIPEGAQIDTFCIKGETLYYSVDFTSYFEDPTGTGKKIPFEDKFNTQIRGYNLANKEDFLLYQYDEGKCVRISDIRCNGIELVWEDYINGYEWSIKKLILNKDSEPVDIVSYDQQKGKLNTITPTITEDSLYWYDLVDDSEKPIVLYRYDFRSKQVTTEQTGLSLQSPYEHINIVDGVYTVYEEEEDSTSVIHIYDMAKKKTVDLYVPGTVCDPVSNGKVCAWMAGYGVYNREYLIVCDLSDRTIERIHVSYGFSFALVGDFILVNQEKGICLYDTEKKEYRNLIPTKRVTHGYIAQGMDGNVFFRDNGTYGKLKIINITTGS